MKKKKIRKIEYMRGFYAGQQAVLENLVRISQDTEITPMMLDDMLKEADEISESRYTVGPIVIRIDAEDDDDMDGNLTPQEFAGELGINFHKLRSILRNLYPNHRSHTRWVITPAMQKKVKRVLR